MAPHLTVERQVYRRRQWWLGWLPSPTVKWLMRMRRRLCNKRHRRRPHRPQALRFVVGHPEKLIDFAYRAEHEMTVEAKTLIHAFYGRDPRYSYWEGCSGGGREGLLQAARYPDEFDGVIAGDPANIRRNAWAL